MSPTAPLLRSVATAAATTCALAACLGAGSTPATLPGAPLATLPAATAPPTAPATVLDPAAATGPTTTVVRTIQLSPDGPWTRVAGAPGVTKPGLVYQLMDGLWVYLPVDENIFEDRTWTLNTEDLPIIEAYLRSRLTYYQASVTNPIDLDHPGWQQWYTRAGRTQVLGWLDERRSQDQVKLMDEGVVLQPQVIGDLRSEVKALVSDCVLDGSVFVLPDGSLAEGSRWGTAPVGYMSVLDLENGRWAVSEVGGDPIACD